MSNYLDPHKGIIAWFARHSVAANLLMFSILILGGLAATKINKQMFPQTQTNYITVNIALRGASPSEVEETVTTKLEEALKGISGLERIITRSNRSFASASLKVFDNYNPKEVLDEVKSKIDSISSFPDGMERPEIFHNEFRQEVMYISLAGDLSLKKLKAVGENIFADIRNLPNINVAEYYSGANYEIGIEVSKNKLREYNLTFDDITNAVRQFSVNRSAGEIRADSGFISVRVENQAYVGSEFEKIPLRLLANGSQLYVGDVAEVIDEFEEGVVYAKLNGMNSVMFYVGATPDQSITELSDIVNQYLEQKNQTLPDEIILETWVDFTYYLEGRLNMMLSNMAYGGFLVFLILTLFLRPRLAFWVMMGLPVSFLGALIFLPLDWIGVTIHVVSLFAFIMVLGVVVDDAIIIGESVHSEVEEEGYHIDHVIRGAQRVATPATFGVLTTVAAFAPLVIENGPNSAFPNAIGMVVVLCLIFSLVESKLILPCHLASMKPIDKNKKNFLDKLRDRVDGVLQILIIRFYQPALSIALEYRYAVLAIFTGVIFLTASMFISGNIRFIGMPKIPHDYIRIKIDMNANASEQATINALDNLQTMVEKVEKNIEKEFGIRMTENVRVNLNSRTSAELQAKLVDPDLRPMDTFGLSKRWREIMPVLPGVKQLLVLDDLFGDMQNDSDVAFRLSSSNDEQLDAASQYLKSELTKIKGVNEVNDSKPDAAIEARFNLKPMAYTLGLTTAEVARQASAGLYGVEAQRIVRDKEEIRVMVRYPSSERNALAEMNAALIRTPKGENVPLAQLADIELTQGVSQIYREEGDRATIIYASIDYDLNQPLKVANLIKDEAIPYIEKNYPRVSLEESGKLKNERSDLRQQVINIFLIMFPIYILLAIPLRSYTQPIMIMSVIPFGVIGAILGHIILGMNLSGMSIFGITAAIGVVVNDSLVMVDYINNARANGSSLFDAVKRAGTKRLRPIVLTSLTTFIGLMPIITETSLQAKIVIPMAVSLAFGVLFATIVTLFLVPSLYIILHDLGMIKNKTRQYFTKNIAKEI